MQSLHTDVSIVNPEPAGASAAYHDPETVTEPKVPYRIELCDGSG